MLSLAIADFAVRVSTHIILGVLIAVVLKMAANKNYTFDHLSFNSVFVLLGYALFLNLTVIAVDRILAHSLYLRYQERVIPKPNCVSFGIELL